MKKALKPLVLLVIVMLIAFMVVTSVYKTNKPLPCMPNQVVRNLDLIDKNNNSKVLITKLDLLDNKFQWITNKFINQDINAAKLLDENNNALDKESNNFLVNILNVPKVNQGNYFNNTFNKEVAISTHLELDDIKGKFSIKSINNNLVLDRGTAKVKWIYLNKVLATYKLELLKNTDNNKINLDIMNIFQSLDNFNKDNNSPFQTFVNRGINKFNLSSNIALYLNNKEIKTIFEKLSKFINISTNFKAPLALKVNTISIKDAQYLFWASGDSLTFNLKSNDYTIGNTMTLIVS